MALVMQDVLRTDSLRYRVIVLKDIGTLVAGANQDVALVHGLNGAGGSILGVYARAGTKPTGTITQCVFDVNKNGTSIFTSTKVAFPKTGAGAFSSGGTLTAAGAQVINGDLITLDCDAIGDATDGANVAVSVVIRCDEPLD